MAHPVESKHEKDGKGAGEGGPDFLPAAVRDLVSGRFLWGADLVRGGVSPISSPKLEQKGWLSEQESPKSSNSGLVSSSLKRRLKDVEEIDEGEGVDNHSRHAKNVKGEKMEGQEKVGDIPSYQPATGLVNLKDFSTSKPSRNVTPSLRHADNQNDQSGPWEGRTDKQPSRLTTSSFQIKTPQPMARFAIPGSAKFASPQVCVNDS